MLIKEEFLKKYNIAENEFRSANISFKELEKIYSHYCSLEPELRSISRDFLDQYLYDTERAGIHSYRYRLKDPGHLIEKIIRKRAGAPHNIPCTSQCSGWNGKFRLT